MKKHIAHAVWNGTLKEGKGTLSTGSKVLTGQPYSFATRFENATGTNPDELLAASHAGCFAMALSLILGKKGFTPDSLEVSAEVTMNPAELELTGSHLTLKAVIPNISQAEFLECANAAKDGCPISKALKFPISLEASLA